MVTRDADEAERQAYDHQYWVDHRDKRIRQHQDWEAQRDPEERRAYHREYYARRRAEFFTGKVCARCGSDENLELDHIDPEVKSFGINWKMARANLAVELAKCQVLCHDCHEFKSADEGDKGRGTAKRGKGIDATEVVEIRLLLSLGWTHQRIADKYGVCRTAITNISTGRSHY